jgi:hypothetical protein
LTGGPDGERKVELTRDLGFGRSWARRRYPAWT